MDTLTKEIMNGSKMIQFLIFSTLFFFNYTFAAENRTYNVRTLGADPNGVSDCKDVFLNAWNAACNTTGRAKIYVPQGTYLLTHTIFYGRGCKNQAITFDIQGTLLAPSNYNATGNANNWLVIYKVTGLTILGGVINGQGASLWACKKSDLKLDSDSDDKNCPHGATSLGIYYSNNITIKGLTSLNSQMFHIAVFECVFVYLYKTKIYAPGDSPNTDGIHIQQSTGVIIYKSIIGTGDDCISMGEGTSNVLIHTLACGPGHGVSIGSLGRRVSEEGVQNVTVKNATFTGTQNGVRIKTWANPSSSFVKNVVFKDIIIHKAKYPAIIDQNYCTQSKSCPKKGGSGVNISEITFENIRGESGTYIAVKLDCSNIVPCNNIKLDTINLTYHNKTATAFCANVKGLTVHNVRPLPVNCL